MNIEGEANVIGYVKFEMLVNGDKTNLDVQVWSSEEMSGLII